MSSIASERGAARLSAGGVVGVAWCSVGVVGGLSEFSEFLFFPFWEREMWFRAWVGVCLQGLGRTFVGEEKEEEISSDVLRFTLDA